MCIECGFYNAIDMTCPACIIKNKKFVISNSCSPFAENFVILFLFWPLIIVFLNPSFWSWIYEFNWLIRFMSVSQSNTLHLIAIKKHIFLWGFNFFVDFNCESNNIIWRRYSHLLIGLQGIIFAESDKFEIKKKVWFILMKWWMLCMPDQLHPAGGK